MRSHKAGSIGGDVKRPAACTYPALQSVRTMSLRLCNDKIQLHYFRFSLYQPNTDQNFPFALVLRITGLSRKSEISQQTADEHEKFPGPAHSELSKV